MLAALLDLPDGGKQLFTSPWIHEHKDVARQTCQIQGPTPRSNGSTCEDIIISTIKSEPSGQFLLRQYNKGPAARAGKGHVGRKRRRVILSDSNDSPDASPSHVTQQDVLLGSSPTTSGIGVQQIHVSGFEVPQPATDSQEQHPHAHSPEQDFTTAEQNLETRAEHQSGTTVRETNWQQPIQETVSVQQLHPLQHAEIQQESEQYIYQHRGSPDFEGGTASQPFQGPATVIDPVVQSIPAMTAGSSCGNVADDTLDDDVQGAQVSNQPPHVLRSYPAQDSITSSPWYSMPIPWLDFDPCLLMELLCQCTHLRQLYHSNSRGCLSAARFSAFERQAFLNIKYSMVKHIDWIHAVVRKLQETNEASQSKHDNSQSCDGESSICNNQRGNSAPTQSQDPVTQAKAKLWLSRSGANARRMKATLSELRRALHQLQPPQALSNQQAAHLILRLLRQVDWIVMGCVLDYAPPSSINPWAYFPVLTVSPTPELLCQADNMTWTEAGRLLQTLHHDFQHMEASPFESEPQVADAQAQAVRNGMLLLHEASVAVRSMQDGSLSSAGLLKSEPGAFAAYFKKLQQLEQAQAIHT